MKLKKILAATLGATLALSTATALAACSATSEQPQAQPLGTSSVKYNVDDYLADQTDFTGYPNSVKGVTQATKINDANETAVTTQNGFAVLRKLTNATSLDYTYRVYSKNADKFIASNLSSQPSLTMLGGYPVVCVSNSGGDHSYIAVDGTTLLSYGDYSNMSASSSTRYVSDSFGKKTLALVLEVSAYKYANSQYTAVKYYFTIETDAYTGKITFTPVGETQLSNNASSDNNYSVGDYLNNRTPIYQSTADQPVEGEIADYSYTVTNNTYTFYKNAQKTGSFTIDYGKTLGFVGNYMYYKTETPVYREATRGFNYVEYDGEIINKYDYRLYRYDIVANSTAELNYSVKIDSTLNALYNYKTKSYDAAAIVYYDMTNGLFVEPDEDEYKSCITDAKLNVAVDLNQKAGYPLYKLDTNRYFAQKIYDSGYVIVDGDLNYVTEALPMYSVYMREKLVTFYTGGKCGLTDYNGKIVVEPLYNNIGNFYGGYACATRTVDNETQYAFIDERGNTDYAPSSDSTMRKTVSAPENGVYAVMTQTDATETKYTVVIYNYAGTLLRTFTDLSYSTARSITNNLDIFVVDTDCYVIK